MPSMYEDLMNGLDEVESFLAGETAGHKVSPPPEVDEQSARNPNAAMEALHPRLQRHNPK